MPNHRSREVDMSELECPHCGMNDGFYGYAVESFTQTLVATMFDGELEFEMYDSDFCDTIESSYRCNACEMEVSPGRVLFRNPNSRNVAMGMIADGSGNTVR